MIPLSFSSADRRVPRTPTDAERVAERFDISEPEARALLVVSGHHPGLVSSGAMLFAAFASLAGHGLAGRIATTGGFIVKPWVETILNGMLPPEETSAG